MDISISTDQVDAIGESCEIFFYAWILNSYTNWDQNLISQNIMIASYLSLGFINWNELWTN